MGAGSGALNSYQNGLNDNNYNDDNRNENVVAAGSAPSNFCLLFSRSSLPDALHPATKHAPNLIKFHPEPQVLFQIAIASKILQGNILVFL